ncbi:uncharacterized protein [Cicer arietinum]|uniref:Uncharacterized protein LOC101500595 isoform X2 n=1 Tax=Cicer arietinum TaxID=3827 RepID=A0A1S3EDU9_CICAR|nr:uncharacterized protein LOC101500595 isoform X2 [Cicer arietinum]
MNDFAEPVTFGPTGLYIGGTKYMAIQGEPGAVIRGKKLRERNFMLHKESRQHDPYGIFNTEESIPRDIGPYKNLVIFTSSSMYPKFISSPSSVPLLIKLRILMSNLQTVDLKGLTNQQKLAFWINLYNACIMHGFIQYGVPSTPEKLTALMNKMCNFGCKPWGSPANLANNSPCF